MQEILTEKYRPREFNDVIGLDQDIPNFVENLATMPHLLFIGPPGTGKTTVAKIIVEKTGADALILNASKDRGIDTIRDRIEPFASKASDRLKIVFLDEFDATTQAFQTALRNFMETYAKSTRFIATCNYPSKIIDPLRSRFKAFQFSRYKKEEIILRLQGICTTEAIQTEPGVFDLLVRRYHDDIRGMINALNKAKGRVVTERDISQENTVLKILAKCKDRKWAELREELFEEQLDYPALIEEMDGIIFRHPQIGLDVKQKANHLFAEYQYKMYFSFNKELCFAALLAELMEVL